MSFNVTGLKMLHILLDHPLLSRIGAVLPGLFQVHLSFFKVWLEFAVFQVESLALESNAVFGFVSVNASDSNDIFLTNFESSGVEDVDALGTEESLYQSEIILGHVSREVACDSTLIRVPELCVGLVDVEDFFLNLRIEFIEHLSVEAVLVVIARI